MIVRAAFSTSDTWREWRLVFWRECWWYGQDTDWLGEAMGQGYHGA